MKINTCGLCNKSFKSILRHVSQKHHISSKDYYDQFLKSPNEGICECGNFTKFNGSSGYSKFCSFKCLHSSLEIKEKKRISYQKHYHCDNPQQCLEIQEKTKNTNIDRYGGPVPSSSKEVQKKQQDTMLKNHGVRYALQSTKFIEKSKQTCLKNNGVENASQSLVIKLKKEKTYQKHYGVDHWSKSNQAKENWINYVKHQDLKNESITPYVSPTGSECLDIFEQKSGFKIIREVKESKYSIDGVPEKTKIAIEFDGRHNFKDNYITLTDHDLQKQKDIESLGYTFFRIKRPDWEKDSETIIQNFLRTIHSYFQTNKP